VAIDSDSQSAIFWDRLRPLLAPSDEEPRPGEEPPRNVVITVCVLLSCILRPSLTLGEQRTQTLRLPVRVVDIPEDKTLAERPTSHVQAQMHERGFSPSPIVNILSPCSGMATGRRSSTTRRIIRRRARPGRRVAAACNRVHSGARFFSEPSPLQFSV
jgi:hypothetical protein